MSFICLNILNTGILGQEQGASQPLVGTEVAQRLGIQNAMWWGAEPSGGVNMDSCKDPETKDQSVVP